MFAIQDQVVLTNNYEKVIPKNPIAIDKCRKCGSKGETIQRISNGCAQLVTSEYESRHDAVGKILHQEIMKCTVREREREREY